MIAKDFLGYPAPDRQQAVPAEMSTAAVHRHLAEIFARLFEDMTPAAAPFASIDTVPDWDGLTTLSLVVEAEDEFGIELGFDLAEEITTFTDLYAHVVMALREAGRLRLPHDPLTQAFTSRRTAGNA